jgi:hypothetical protein
MIWSRCISSSVASTALFVFSYSCDIPAVSSRVVSRELSSKPSRLYNRFRSWNVPVYLVVPVLYPNAFVNSRLASSVVTCAAASIVSWLSELVLVYSPVSVVVTILPNEVWARAPLFVVDWWLNDFWLICAFCLSLTELSVNNEFS